jgi:hydrogenase maturation protease
VYDLVVIGFGNTLRQDDGFGPAVVAELMQRVQDERIGLLSPSTLTPELAAILAESRAVIFVDACATLKPGAVECRSMVCDPRAEPSLVHFLSPDALLVWTERLYGRVPKAELWLVGTEQTGLCEDLTPVVATRVGEFVAAIEQRIRGVLDQRGA